MNEIADNLARVNSRIAEAANRAGRDPKEIKLLAVSKMKPLETVQAAVDAGHWLFAENYVQAAREKFPHVVAKERRLELHMIGALQRNKVARAIELFDVIETVDRLSLAEEISKQAQRLETTQRILIQVNISGEQTKSGCAPDEVADLCRAALSLPGLQVEGLMSIGTWYEPGTVESISRKEFQQMRELRDVVAAELGVSLSELSMGMSGDFELAIEEGASIVRVGSSIFGARG